MSRCVLCEQLNGTGRKHCPDCGAIKPVSEFHRAAANKSGRVTFCKPCTLLRVSAHQKTERGRALNRERRRRYNASPRGRATNAAWNRRDNRIRRADRRTRLQAWRAVKAGLIIRQPCEVCGDLKVEAHHEDYSEPLDVRWLCRLHHIATRTSAPPGP